MQKKHKKETHRIENKYKKKMVQEEEKIKCQQIYNHVEYYLFWLQLKAVFLNLVYFADEHFRANRLLIKYWR